MRINARSIRPIRLGERVLLLLVGLALLPTGADAQARRVPRLIGMTVDEARSELARSDSTLRLIVQGPQGEDVRIVNQAPASTVPFQGAEVVVTTRRVGVPTVTVPDVTGQASSDAEEAVRAAGLVLRVQGPVPEPPLLVNWQSPAGGETAARGDDVFVTLEARATDTVYVADSVTIPDLSRLDRGDAEVRLAEIGLRFGLLDDFPAPAPNAVVWHQDPAPGTMGRIGDSALVALLPGQATPVPWWRQTPWSWLIPGLGILLGVWLLATGLSALIGALRPWRRDPGAGPVQLDVKLPESLPLGPVDLKVALPDGREWQADPDPEIKPVRSSKLGHSHRDRWWNRPVPVPSKRRAGHVLEGRPVWPVPDGPTPRPFDFTGPFAREDREGYFGREEEAARLFNAVHEYRLVVLHGAAGSGKTSLIHCGLGSHLMASDWLPLVIERESDINAALRATLHQAGASAMPRSDAWDRGAPSDVTELLRSLYQTQYRTPYLIFDSFEDLLENGTSREQRELFLTLATVLTSDAPAKVILSVREEALELLEPFETLLPSLRHGRIGLKPMEPRNVARTVLGIARWVGLDITPADQVLIKILDRMEGGEVANLTRIPVLLDHLWMLALDELDEQGNAQEGAPPGAPDAVSRHPTITPDVVERTRATYTQTSTVRSTFRSATAAGAST